MPTKEIEKKSLTLNALDKIHLIEKLLSSLDKPDPEIEKAWIKEAVSYYINSRYEKFDGRQSNIKKLRIKQCNFHFITP